MKVIIPELARGYVANGWWPNRSFVEVAADTIRRNADREMVVDGDQRFTFSQIDDMATRLARNLRKLGLRKGETVSVQMPNCHQVFVAHLAIAKLGCVLNLIVPAYRDRELKFILNSECSAIAIVPGVYGGWDYAEMIRRLKPELPHLRHIIVSADSEECGEFLSLDPLIQSAPDTELSCEPVVPDDVRLTVYTAGTTGEPKGVQHSHNTLLAMEYDQNRVLGIGEQDVSLACLSICHMLGFNFALDATFVLGCKVVLLDKWDAERAACFIERERCTITVLVPTMLQELLEQSSVKRRDLGSMRWCGCGGAAVAPHLIERAWNELGWSNTCRIYGLSEATNIALGAVHGTSPDENRLRGATTDGRIVGNYEVKLVDPDRKKLAPIEEGELAVRGPQLFLGYVNAQANMSCFDDEGFYYTGDMGRIDQDGCWTATGRSKDIIIRAGENISAKEIEDFLATHNLIAEACCVAMPDPQMGEKVCAYARLKQGLSDSDLSLLTLNDFLLKQGLSKRKLPERLEIVVDFPRSSIGKINKAQLRKDIAAKLELPSVSI